jgi:hypothetical protein
MADHKNKSAKRETKAGMLGKNSDSEAEVEKKRSTDDNRDETPKSSKKQIDRQSEDKPLH